MSADSDPQPEASAPLQQPFKIDRVAVVASITAALIAVVFYWLTAYRTITWWDSGEYSLAAICLGIPHPPGSQLAVWLGWLATKLPLGLSKIVVLNCVAGVFAAAATGLACSLALNLFMHQAGISRERIGSSSAILLGAIAAVASLTFALGDTLWTLATRFTPYTLTPVFTALILWCLLRWWYESHSLSSIRRLLAMALLLGLDFSVHRTNLLLAPGILVWLLLRQPRTLASLKTWLTAGVAFVAGLAFHLTTIPLAARKPALNMCDPSNWSRFWDYITLKQYGGGMLINLFPRKAPFFSVQMADYWKIFSDNFAHFFGGTILLGVAPLLLGLFGVFVLWRNDRKLAIGTIVLFLCASVLGVFYFNTQANFFRSMDRHYLPSLLIFTIWIVYGVCALFAITTRLHARGRQLLAAVVAALVLACAVHQIARNYPAVDSSRKYFTIDFANNALKCLPPNAIVFSGGDNDTWPLLYAQRAEGVRPDVDVINVYLLNTPWFTQQLLERRPDFPLSLSREEINRMSPIPWQDSTISIAVNGSPADFALPPNSVLPDSIRLHVTPTIAGKLIMISDQHLLRIVAENKWKRPICFLTTVVMDNMVGLQPFARGDGMFHRIVPQENPPENRDLLESCLLRECEYRGYADSSVALDDVTRMMGLNYCAELLRLMVVQSSSGDTLACAATRESLLKWLPPDRLDWPQSVRQGANQLCTKSLPSMEAQ